MHNSCLQVCANAVFLSLIHVAILLQSDILAHPPNKGLKVSKEAATIQRKLYTRTSNTVCYYFRQ